MAQTPNVFSQFSLTALFLPPKLFLIRRQFSNLGFQIKLSNNISMSVKCTNTSMTAPEVTVKGTIDLTEKEEIIFNRLLDVLKHFDLDTQLRVAGGWVRDKLLGKDCYDIDIALDNMLGREFCEKVNEYLKYTGEEEQGKVAVIQSNPDQSKHLETARMWIYETWIDFVNLRSETYMENSRIPMMKFGTAKEDAYRRDLTINSLFYNINTRSVEDFTGRGVQDLKNGYIVTPLPPKSTFLDDPLRVLRAIRFGARFDFELDEELKIAASDDEVKTSLAHKISRERIGHEVDLMISGNHPIKAITHICDLQLFFVVFALPENQQLNVKEGCDRDCIYFMDASWKLLQSLGFLKFSDEQNKLYLYGSLFLPLRHIVYTDRKMKKIPVTSYILRDSLKLKSNYADMVVSLHSACEKFISLIPLLESMEDNKIFMPELEDEFLVVPETSEKRVLAGLLLRQIKNYWRVALLMSALIYTAPDQGTDASHIDLDRAKDIYLRVESTITGLDLDKVWDFKPLLDGKAIMAELKLEKGGPLVREWQERILKWQLAYPEATAEECLHWIRRFQTKRAKLE